MNRIYKHLIYQDYSPIPQTCNICQHRCKLTRNTCGCFSSGTSKAQNLFRIAKKGEDLRLFLTVVALLPTEATRRQGF